MGAITRFEDIEAWQLARLLVSATFEICKTTPLRREYGLKDQIQRSAVSIMANIAEGFGRRGHQEFIQYLRIARGSCSEVQSHLYVALDAGHIDQETFRSMQDQATLVGRKISAFIQYLNSTSRSRNKKPSPRAN